MKAWLLKLHRWVALVFALPLVVVLGTGLVLSFEPWIVVNAIEPNSLIPSKIETLLTQARSGRPGSRNLLPELRRDIDDRRWARQQGD